MIAIVNCNDGYTSAAAVEDFLVFSNSIIGVGSLGVAMPVAFSFGHVHVCGSIIHIYSLKYSSVWCCEG